MSSSVHEICQRGSLQPFPDTTIGGVGSRCQPARAIARAATAMKHEPGLSPLYRVVSYGSAREVWALPMRLLSRYLRARMSCLGPLGEIVSLPACTQRSICRCAALASRPDPLSFSGDKRGRCKALFFAVLNGTAISDPEPVNFSCDPESWAYGQATSESTGKDVISARISFPTRAAIVPLLDWLRLCGARKQWRACVRRMLRCKLACVLPPSSLDPS